MDSVIKKLDARFRYFYYTHASLNRLDRLMRYTRSGKPLPIPRFMFVEPTNACNYKCPKCPQVTGLGRKPAFMDVDLFRDLINQIKKDKPTITLHHSGEPLLHPRLFDMIRIAREAGVGTIVVTNASLLHRDDFRVLREGPDAITFSVDGASAAAYEPRHGGAPWETIKNNIEEFFRRHDATSPIRRVQISMVQNSQKPEEIQEFVDFAKRFPFVMLIRPSFVWPDSKSVTPIPQYPESYWTYPCGHPWLSPAILSDGSVVPCCLDAHGSYRAGNINEKPFMEIFSAERLNHLRRHLLDLEGTPPLPLCDSCGIKKLAIPISFKGRIAFHTLPLWKHFFTSLAGPVDA